MIKQKETNMPLYAAFAFFLFVFDISVLAADTYILKESVRKKSAIDYMPKAVIFDMKNIPQDLSYYAKQIKPFSASDQRVSDREYNQKYFRPWELKQIDIPAEDFGWEMRFVRKEPIYRQNGRIIPASIYEKWIKNANMSALNSKKYKAITIRRCDVKALPTTNTFYRNPKRAGEGFPFDYNQNSAYHINLPLFVSHFSLDGRWAFVRGSYTFGWIKTDDMALVSKSFQKEFKNGTYAITIKDNLRLYTSKNKHVSLVKLGALFPVSKDKKHYLVATKDKNSHAKIQKVSVLNPNIIAKKPLAFTAENVANVASEFYDEPYGWGGRNECRDCSATTRDFMGVFGIFLSRNSSKQAKDGIGIQIAGLSKEAKKRKIIHNAKPFRSLLYVPGHVALYLGQFNGEPVIMHTYWGIRKNDGTKLVTGRTIITTTEPGKERRDIKEKSKLINTLKTIVNF